MGLAQLVYPGAVHTRFHHSLGACHLMGEALDVLSSKGIEVRPAERLAARAAILLHDVGHGPFSHSLEGTLIAGTSHEAISRQIIVTLNAELNGDLQEALLILDNKHPKPFLHQLVSSQLDMDRMDYLNRDSYYTGVSEGVIGYHRILQMLTVHEGQLVVEQKAIHSAEKFIIARRLMYWQVYLHKTVLGAEQLIVKILQRAKEIAQQDAQLYCTPALHAFLHENVGKADLQNSAELLARFCELTDDDIMVSARQWQRHPDMVLQTLCRSLIERKLFKVKLSAAPLLQEVEEKRQELKRKTNFTQEMLSWFVFSGKTQSSTYNTTDEKICILHKDGRVTDISEVEDALVTQTLARPVLKNYICYLSL